MAKPQQHEPTPGATSYDYDRHGRLVSVTDAEGRTTTFAWDQDPPADPWRLDPAPAPEPGDEA